MDEGQKWVQEHFAPWAKSFLETRQRSRWKEMTDVTNQAGYRGVWVTFQGIRIDNKLAAIQKLQALGIISEKKWWSDKEVLAHRLKFGRIGHATITVRVLPNEPPRLFFVGMEFSLDPDVTCDMQKSKNVLPEKLQCPRTTWGRCPLPGNHENMASPVAQPGCHGKSNPMPHPTQR